MEWAKLADVGAARVKVNGREQPVVVQSEQCSCRGRGWHERRFLSLSPSAGVRESDRETVTARGREVLRSAE